MKMRSTLRALAGRVTSIFGRHGGGSLFSLFASLVASNNQWINWNEEAGARYDNSAVMAAIAWIQRRLSEPVLTIERKGNKEWTEVVDHDLPFIIENGPAYDGTSLLWATVLSLITCGNAYWYKIRSASGKLIGFVLLDQSRTVPKADKYHSDARPYALITYYEFRNPEGEVWDIDPKDVVHFRFGLNPANPRLGMSPISAALRDIVTDNEAAQLGVALIRNGGIPGIAFEPKEAVTGLTPDQETELQERISKRIAGPGAGRPILMPMPGQWRTIGFEPDKLVLNQTRALAVSRILSAIGIDPMVLGFPSENKTYSNYAEANEAAVENCFLPLLSLIASTLTSQVIQVDYEQAPRVRHRVSWDTTNVRALQPDLDKLWERVGKAWDRNLIKRSKALALLNQEFDKSEDDVYAADIQMAAMPMAQPEDEPGDEKKEDKRSSRFLEIVAQSRERARMN